ncbi:MAG: FAD-binding protein, partial [Duncaniella sp.]|nr:FAD-binding protein [Duncaniella sp.]
MIRKYDNFDLSAVTTFAVPARCRVWVEYDEPSDIPEVLSLGADGAPLMHIGEGSNMLFTRDYPGVVAHSRVKGIEIIGSETHKAIVRVGAGERMDSFVEWACSHGLWGIENLSGIPGEVGASAVQNVGAYGTEAADTIVAVHAYDAERREFVIIDASDCHFGYRDSVFKHSPARDRYVIHHVDYALDTQIANYSRGMRQKICIVGALVHEPKLLILDEPMAGLDPQTIRLLCRFIRDYAN